MKKLILFIAIPLLFVACKGNENKSDATATDSSSTAAPVDTSAATSATQYTCPTKIFLLAAAIITLIGFYSYNAAYSFEKNTPSAGNSITDSTVTKTYTCPMHPEVMADKPGACPQCGMELQVKS